MRGPVERQNAMLLGVAPEDFVPPDHPIRRIKSIPRERRFCERLHDDFLST